MKFYLKYLTGKIFKMKYLHICSVCLKFQVRVKHICLCHIKWKLFNKLQMSYLKHQMWNFIEISENSDCLSISPFPNQVHNPYYLAFFSR